LLISNADIVLGAGALEVLAAVGEADAGIGAVGPLVRELDGSVYPSARPLPGLMLGAGHALFGRVWPGNPWTRRYRPTFQAGGPDRDAGWLSGSCLLVRRDAWEGIGGFDEEFFMFFEDVDLGRRLGQAGFRSVWTSRAEVTHIGGHSWRSDPAPMLAAHHASAERYVRLRYPRGWQAPIRAAVSKGLASRLRREIASARATPSAS
jgi:N-acetylglucosaminyl-diphospho-decaprenol L-rhamnosyltransferase